MGNISFNTEGKIVFFDGPVLVDHSLLGDPNLLKKADSWRLEFEAWPKIILGIASDNVNLSGCSTRDCFMSSFFNDAMLRHARTVAGGANAGRAWPDFAFANTGAIRAGIPKGDITVKKLPLTRQEILDMLEGVVVGKNMETGKAVTSLIQVSGFNFSYDSTKPANDTSGHIIKTEIQGRTKNWNRIVPVQTYSVITMDLMVTGGDNILVKGPRLEAITLERVDEILMVCVGMEECITPYVDERIRDVGPGMERDYSEMMVIDLMSYMVDTEG